MERFIMALDAGTTSARCILFDKNASIRAVAQRELGQSFPQDGWVEQDPRELWETQLAVARQAMQRLGVGAEAIAAIGITNQRETTIVWNRRTGEPVYPAIVWQCRRTAARCDALRAQGWEADIRRRTGLVLDPYFSATKLQWILERIPREQHPDLLFGTVDSWLIWNLTEGRAHVTDYANAARTMLFNIHTRDWDPVLLERFGVPRSLLPTPVENSALYGTTSLLGGSIPIAGSAGDQQAALFGQGCFAPGQVKNTYGTGGFLLMNTGEEPVTSQNGLLTTLAWGLNGKATYALEGSIFVAGAVIQWLRDEVGLLHTAAQSEALAATVPDTNGCYLVPAFTGLGAPYWDPYARGVLVGLSRGVNKSHIIRAALESMAFQTVDVVEAMEADARLSLPGLRVDGGAAANDLLLQTQADLLGKAVVRPACIETTARGAAFLAGLAVGFWEDTEALAALCRENRCFLPQPRANREERLAQWHKAVSRSRDWARD